MWSRASRRLFSRGTSRDAAVAVATAVVSATAIRKLAGQFGSLGCEDKSSVRRSAHKPERPTAEVSVGTYNVLSPFYAVKWGESEGMDRDGKSNWAQRWPIMCEYITRSKLDVVCLQEVENTEFASMSKDLGEEYATFYFKHEKRPPDGLMIAVRTDTWEQPTTMMDPGKGVALGLVDVIHRRSQQRVRVVTAHCRGCNKEQLASLSDFADAGSSEPHVTVITGDFNEDFRDAAGEVICPFPSSRAGTYETLKRTADLPALSRPPRKQGADQSSGKGKVDWIFVRGHSNRCRVELYRDPASRLAILSSHAPCSATGQWPSDHGCEALTIRMYAPAKLGLHLRS